MSKQRLGRIEDEKGAGKVAVFFLMLIFLTTIVAAFFLVRLNEREKPTITIELENEFFGVTKEMHLSVIDEKSGLKNLEILMRKGGKEAVLFRKKFPRRGYFSNSGPNRIEDILVVETDDLDLRDGAAEIEVNATDYSFWDFMKGNTTSISKKVIIDTKIPVVTIEDSPRYIKPGGSGVVVYKLSEPPQKHGARVNDLFYPGFPLPHKGEKVYAAILGLPYDTKSIERMQIVAEDRAGNEGLKSFRMILRKVAYKKDRIQVSDNFLKEKLPEFLQYYNDVPGDSELDQYLYINKEMRKMNNETIREVSSEVTPERLWSGRFGRLPRSSRRANYADTRFYYYDNRKVDQQVHLGIDLASVKHAEVIAANKGRVAFADYLGIYGNMVILDHGQGVYSIYSHLSQINVPVGKIVESNAPLGKTGTSGMAGGDHLHFGMVVNGVFVDPVEWWDKDWLQINILSYL